MCESRNKCSNCGNEFSLKDRVKHICRDCFNLIPIEEEIDNDELTTAQAPEPVLAGIVNRPQFDLDYYSVNSAVHVTEAGRKGVEEFNGIVIKSEPCELSVAWFDEDGDANDDYLIDIDQVINGNVKLRKLT